VPAVWQQLAALLDIAPHRAAHVLDDVAARLGDDVAAVHE